jgi:hypothetical protein
LLKIRFGIAANNDAYAMTNFENIVNVSNQAENEGNLRTFIPVDFMLFKDLFKLFVNRDNFKGLGSLINYAEERKLKLTSLDLSIFKPSLEYYLNHNFKLSNIMIFLKFYVNKQESLFKEFNLTPEKVRTLNHSEIQEYSNFLFPHSDLVDMRDLFSYLVKRVGSNRIIDNHTKKDIMQNFIKYFVDYTIPFMDTSHLVNNFIRENDVSLYLANKFDEHDSMQNVLDTAFKYGERPIYHDFIMQKLKDYQNENFGRLPASYTKPNIMNYTEKLDTRTKNKPTDKTNELLLMLMQNNNMVEEMKHIRSPLSNHYITEAICGLKSDGSSDFYSKQVTQLFNSKKSKHSDLYHSCMIKALLKEGDIESALRVLDEGDRTKIGRKAAIEKYYINIYDHCFGKTDTNDRHVNFLPDLMAEREQRISKELERAAKVSHHEANRIKERVKKTNVSNNLPVSYSDFKSKHFNMVKTLKNNTQQMLLMKMVRSAIKDSDYKHINKIFSYLLVNKEEEDLKRLTRNRIEAYSKIHSPKYERLSFKEANDPLRILFDYVKKPYDDIETLVTLSD